MLIASGELSKKFFDCLFILRTSGIPSSDTIECLRCIISSEVGIELRPFNEEQRNFKHKQNHGKR